MINYTISKRLLFIVLCLFSMAVTDAQTVEFTTASLGSTADLPQYKGSAKALLVADSLSGGLFYQQEGRFTPDFGVVFPSATKGVFWVRNYDKANGV
ncbi:MAG: hypothetical protein EBZ77_03210 [Chitinophagia bacterium]|nr:hypothetical protein [Chitinophagia bacterium]